MWSCYAPRHDEIVNPPEQCSFPNHYACIPQLQIYKVRVEKIKRRKYSNPQFSHNILSETRKSTHWSIWTQKVRTTWETTWSNWHGRGIHLTAVERVLLVSTRAGCATTLHGPGLKLDHNKPQRTEILWRMLPCHNVVGSEKDNDEPTRTFAYVWKLRSGVLSSRGSDRNASTIRGILNGESQTSYTFRCTDNA